MTTRQLFYLVTIADFGNLSRAAQALGVSQPALSKLLASCEAALEVPLFLRSRRRLLPTPAGHYVFSCAQKILTEQTQMLQSIRAITSEGSPRLRLSTAPNRGALLYSRIYNRFVMRYPGISLSLNELYASEQPGAIRRGQVDIAVGVGRHTGETDVGVGRHMDGTAVIPFAREELLVCLPASHPLASRERIALADLRDTPFVLQSTRHSIRALADELFAAAGFQPVIAFESSDVLLIDSMLHQQLGAGLVSKVHVCPCAELVYRSLDPPVYQSLYIRYPLGHTLTGPEQFLAGLLIRERLSDPRYLPVPSAEVSALLALTEGPPAAASGSAASDDAPGSHASDDTSGPTASNDAPGPAASGDTSGPAAPVGTAAGKTAPAAAPSAGGDTLPFISLNTQLLKYLVAIADEKSLTRAAEKYYLSQPALSRCLRDTETMLSAKLFSRVHNRLQPTNAGKIFLGSARSILEIEAEMMLHIRTCRPHCGDSITLYCGSPLADLIRGTVADDFAYLCPEISLHILEGDRDSAQEALLNASADLALYFSHTPEHPVLDIRVLTQHELRCRTLADGVPETAASAAQRWRPCTPPKFFYLLLARHPQRNLPPAAEELVRLLYEKSRLWQYSISTAGPSSITSP